jgi:hypothetical protein
MGPPIIYGDTRSLCLSPHNASYPELKPLLSKGWTLTDKSRFDYFLKPSLMHVARQSISFQQPPDFMKLALPKAFGDSPLFLCPKDPYLDMINLREDKFAHMQRAIKGKNLTSE